LIFIFIGLQFPSVIKNIPKAQVWPYVGYSFLITVVALALRMVRVFLQKINLQNAFKNGKHKITIDELPDFKSSLIISW